jgi:hypothetical protein
LTSASSQLDDPTFPMADKRDRAPAHESQPLPLVLRYFDVVLVVVAGPILLLIGVSAVGYLAGAGAWIVLRAVGVAVERYAAAARSVNQEITLRLGYLLSRLFLLAITVILVRKDHGRDAGLTALLVIVFAFTAELFVSFANRPRKR